MPSDQLQPYCDALLSLSHESTDGSVKSLTDVKKGRIKVEDLIHARVENRMCTLRITSVDKDAIVLHGSADLVGRGVAYCASCTTFHTIENFPTKYCVMLGRRKRFKTCHKKMTKIMNRRFSKKNEVDTKVENGHSQAVELSDVTDHSTVGNPAESESEKGSPAEALPS